mmetsp:Transcript_130188/g.417814  ORF Transcript_130188/g.417814 Transcript_130188/m.417814 type:complete len:231 (-) Transcript_130188:654-1346(-)
MTVVPVLLLDVDALEGHHRPRPLDALRRGLLVLISSVSRKSLLRKARSAVDLLERDAEARGGQRRSHEPAAEDSVVKLQGFEDLVRMVCHNKPLDERRILFRTLVQLSPSAIDNKCVLPATLSQHRRHHLGPAVPSALGVAMDDHIEVEARDGGLEGLDLHQRIFQLVRGEDPDRQPGLPLHPHQEFQHVRSNVQQSLLATEADLAGAAPRLLRPLRLRLLATAPPQAAV